MQLETLDKVTLLERLCPHLPFARVVQSLGVLFNSSLSWGTREYLSKNVLFHLRLTRNLCPFLLAEGLGPTTLVFVTRGWVTSSLGCLPSP